MTQGKSAKVLNGIGLLGVSVLATVGTPCWLLLAYVQAKLVTATWTFAQSAWASLLVADAVAAVAAAWFFWARRRYVWSWTSVVVGASLFFGLLHLFERI